MFGDTLYALPDAVHAGNELDGLRVLRAGLALGQLKKGRFEPDHALALFLKPGQVVRKLNFSSDDPHLLAYLRGETIPIDSALSGYTLITADSFSLGWGKASGGILKNHYPKGLRRMG